MSAMLDARPDWDLLSRAERLALIAPAAAEGWAPTRIAMLFRNATRQAIHGYLSRHFAAGAPMVPMRADRAATGRRRGEPWHPLRDPLPARAWG